MRPNHLLPVLFFALLCLGSRPAAAAMVFCNRGQNPVEAAVGYRESIAWISEGWWRIEPGQCARVYGKPLTQRYYYYYAKSLVAPVKGKASLIWAGKYKFCIDTKAFRIEGYDDCEARNYQTQGFQEIDIDSTMRDYTLDFRDSGTGH